MCSAYYTHTDLYIFLTVLIYTFSIDHIPGCIITRTVQYLFKVCYYNRKQTT